MIEVFDKTFQAVENYNIKVFSPVFYKKLVGSNPTQWILGQSPCIFLFVIMSPTS